VGRTIPSISHRLESKLRQWERFSKQLHGRDRKAYSELVSVIRNHRTAIDAADEADLGVAILLAVATHLKGELDERTGDEEREGEDRAQLP
jgi:hypothetical protein